MQSDRIGACTGCLLVSPCCSVMTQAAPASYVQAQHIRAVSTITQPQQVQQQLYMSARRGSSLRALQLHLPDGVLLPAGFLHHQLVHYSSTFNRGSFPKRMSSTPDGRVLFNPRGSDIQVSTGLSHRGAWLLHVAQCSAGAWGLCCVLQESTVRRTTCHHACASAVNRLCT